jgi:hypothetical protein
MENLVARTILKQLGGNRFSLMTGSSKFIAGKYTLSFKIVRNPSKANYCRITLNCLDLYDMEFFRSRKGELELIEKKEGLYDDMLQSSFTEVTKLYTRL